MHKAGWYSCYTRPCFFDSATFLLLSSRSFLSSWALSIRSLVALLSSFLLAAHLSASCVQLAASILEGKGLLPEFASLYLVPSPIPFVLLFQPTAGVESRSGLNQNCSPFISEALLYGLLYMMGYFACSIRPMSLITIIHVRIFARTSRFLYNWYKRTVTVGASILIGIDKPFTYLIFSLFKIKIQINYGELKYKFLID